jgi:magnesium-transporting ATPase (P-type)
MLPRLAAVGFPVLQIQEAMLTGESVPVSKVLDAVKPESGLVGNHNSGLLPSELSVSLTAVARQRTALYLASADTALFENRVRCCAGLLLLVDCVCVVCELLVLLNDCATVELQV